MGDAELTVPPASIDQPYEGRVRELAAGDFLDVAQSVERQELARLGVLRLSERARRLNIALQRFSTGEYGICSGCGASISPKRLRALPDVTTCVACQANVEHATKRT